MENISKTSHYIVLKRSIFFVSRHHNFFCIFYCLYFLFVTDGLRANKISLCLFLLCTPIMLHSIESFLTIISSFTLWGCVRVWAYTLTEKDVFLNIFLLCGRNINEFFRKRMREEQNCSRHCPSQGVYNVIYFKYKYQYK